MLDVGCRILDVQDNSLPRVAEPRGGFHLNFEPPPPPPPPTPSPAPRQPTPAGPGDDSPRGGPIGQNPMRASHAHASKIGRELVEKRATQNPTRRAREHGSRQPASCGNQNRPVPPTPL